jgi:hypothetical protein
MNLAQIHISKSRWDTVALLIAALALSGCSGVSTGHYFAVVDLDDPNSELTFYRVNINADSFLTTSQYSSGFYDADALHQLFGEVKTQESTGTKSQNGKSAPATNGAGTLSAGTLQLMCNAKGSCEVGGANDRFTVIYGANADAIADQIRVFAENENTGKQIASLLAASAAADTFERTVAAEQNTEQVKTSATALAKQLKSLAEDIGTAKAPEAVRGALLRAAQQASQKAGSSAVFDMKDFNKGFTQAEAVYEALQK